MCVSVCVCVCAKWGTRLAAVPRGRRESNKTNGVRCGAGARERGVWSIEVELDRNGQKNIKLFGMGM